jgi:hypothetical protein
MTAQAYPFLQPFSILLFVTFLTLLERGKGPGKAPDEDIGTSGARNFNKDGFPTLIVK